MEEQKQKHNQGQIDGPVKESDFQQGFNPVPVNICACYSVKWYDFIVPTNYILYKLCYRSDKTKMFLVTIIRIVVLVGLLMVLYGANYVAFRSGFRSKKYWLWAIISLIVVNIISLGIIVAKENVFDEKLIAHEAEEEIESKLKKYQIKVTDDLSFQLF